MLAVFSLTALMSAFLLFWVEPLFAKMVLPLLGGSPAVWNTCLMFFQAMLLLGYLYAHVSSRYLGPRRQATLHVGLLALALLTLPVGIPSMWIPPASGNVIPWLLGLLGVGVGAPFFTLAASAPLLQRWLASLDHPASQNPYMLYAASNAGSLFGLLAFPLAMEPNVRLGDQSRLWSMGYIVVLALTVVCAVVVRRRSQSTGSTSPATALDEDDVRAPGWSTRAKWIALSFAPSSLLLGVTTYLSTDVAAVPLLWVVPLALYLITFIVVFARQSRKPMKSAALIHAGLAASLALIVFWDPDLNLGWEFALNLAVFAATALVLHGELAASRPAPAHLTEFYLWMALGGALGGAFNALAAPLLFDSIAEYQLVFVLACFLRPTWRSTYAGALSPDGLPSIVVAVVPAIFLSLFWNDMNGREILGVSLPLIFSVIAVVLILALSSNALRFGISIAAIAIVGELFVHGSPRRLFADRSFFGAYRVDRFGGPANFLTHGTTIHGAEFVDALRRLQPVTYYHNNGPAGQLFAALEGKLANNQIGVVGLGAGSLLCYSKPGQEWTFFEIDPLVERIARNPKYFAFLKDCAVKPKVVIGDARLTLARQPASRFGLLIIDAFSSDAIPVHLLTREALGVYRRVLEEHGILFLHISNQRLDLEPVVAALARDAGMVALLNDYTADKKREDTLLDYSADWVVLARRQEDLGPLAGDSRWRPLEEQGIRGPWTDDYSNIFSVIKW